MKYFRTTSKNPDLFGRLLRGGQQEEDRRERRTSDELTSRQSPARLLFFLVSSPHQWKQGFRTHDSRLASFLCTAETEARPGMFTRNN